MLLTTSAEGLIFVLTRLYFYSVLLPYETSAFQLRSPQKQKIGLHSPDLHKMVMGPKARDNVQDPHKQRSMQEIPWFCEEQADVMLNYLPLRDVLT